MELNTVLIGMGMLLVFMAPVYLLVQSGNQKKKKQIAALKDFARQSGDELAEIHSWCNTYLLATDMNESALFYANSEDQLQPFRKLSLKEKARCEVVTEARTLKSGKETVRVINRIFLQIETKQGKGVTERLLIYDASSDPSLSDQVQIAEKWQQRVSTILKNNEFTGEATASVQKQHVNKATV